jgi:hypothetical protein
VSKIIGDYATYTAQQKKDILMSAVPIGDADELHSAAIQLCDIAKANEARIEQLTKRIEALEVRVDDTEAVARRVSCYENGISPD